MSCIYDTVHIAGPPFFCVWLGISIINRNLQVITSRNCSYQICWPAALAVPHIHIVCVAFCIKWTHIWICKTYKKYQHHTALPNPLAELLNINFSDKCNEIGVFHWSMYAHKWMHFIQYNRQATRTIKEEVVEGLLYSSLSKRRHCRYHYLAWQFIGVVKYNIKQAQYNDHLHDMRSMIRNWMPWSSQQSNESQSDIVIVVFIYQIQKLSYAAKTWKTKE